MALCIDSTDPAYIALVTNALDTLAGGVANALIYTPQSYRMGGRSVVRVTEGPSIVAAQAARVHSVTLIRRIIASDHWVRVVESHTNDCSPDKWLKDQAWSGFKSLVPFVSADAGFMRKVLTQGSSAVANWSGINDQTANLGMMGMIRMELAPAYILLAHEMIHADRITRGLLQMRRCNCTFVVDQRQAGVLGVGPNHLRQQANVFRSGQVTGGGANVQFATGPVSNANQVLTNLNAGWVWADGTMELAEEVATVGLSDDDGVIPLDPLAITENMIRAEHFQHKRLKYGMFTRALVM
jgi:hypothetical protein